MDATSEEMERARYQKCGRIEWINCCRCQHACDQGVELSLGVWLRGGRSWLCESCCIAISDTWQCVSCLNWNAGDEYCRCTALERAREEGMVVERARKEGMGVVASAMQQHVLTAIETPIPMDDDEDL